MPDRAARMQQDALEMLPKPADPSSCVWTYVHRDCQYLPAANTPCHPPFGRSHGRGRRFESCSAHQEFSSAFAVLAGPFSVPAWGVGSIWTQFGPSPGKVATAARRSSTPGGRKFRSSCARRGAAAGAERGARRRRHGEAALRLCGAYADVGISAIMPTSCLCRPSRHASRQMLGPRNGLVLAGSA